MADALEPPLVMREQWGADPRLLDQKPHYADSVRAVVIHHTNNPNGYACEDSARLVREIYKAHATSKGWGDLGYNFLVDKCGTIFEGRLGGADRAVIGAHTVGLNRGTTGIAAIGSYTAGVTVPKPLRESLEKLVAWKLAPDRADPAARARLVSSNDNSRFPKGTAVTMATVFGHIDAYETNCPGEALVRLLPTLRRNAARLQDEAEALARKDRGQPGRQEGRSQDSPPPTPRGPRPPGSEATDRRPDPAVRDDLTVRGVRPCLGAVPAASVRSGCSCPVPGSRKDAVRGAPSAVTGCASWSPWTPGTSRGQGCDRCPEADFGP